MRIPLSILASTATLALLALVVSPVGANESHFGVDDWKATDIAKHIKADVNIDVDASAIEAVGLSGTTLWELTDKDLTDLGFRLALKPAEFDALMKSLAQVIHRANAKPVDFWEWRAVNRRLFDTWVLPLGLNDRALLIWMRFFDSNEAIGNTASHVPLSMSPSFLFINNPCLPPPQSTSMTKLTRLTCSYSPWSGFLSQAFLLSKSFTNHLMLILT
jgi:hypothetical protein